MKKCRITVMRKAEYRDLSERYEPFRLPILSQEYPYAMILPRQAEFFLQVRRAVRPTYLHKAQLHTSSVFTHPKNPLTLYIQNTDIVNYRIRIVFFRL